MLDTYKKETSLMPSKPLKATRGQRPYIEAFPVLDLLTVEKHWRRGKTVCQWTNDEGVIIGHVAVDGLDGDRLLIRNHFLGATNVGQLHITLEVTLRWFRRRTGDPRPMMLCPGCDKPRARIVLVAQAWGCRECHDLCNVLTRTSNLNRNLRRLKQLRVMIKLGRRKSQQMKSFNALKTEYALLTSDHGGFPEVDDYLGYFQIAEWMKPGDARIKDEPERKDHKAGVYLWEPGGTGGFQRLHWLEGARRTMSPAEIRRHLATRRADDVAEWLEEEESGTAARKKPYVAKVPPAKGWAQPGVRKRAFKRMVMVDPNARDEHDGWVSLHDFGRY